MRNQPSTPEIEALLALKRRKRRKLFIILLTLFTLIFILPVVCVLLYAQSDHAFHTFVMPAIAKGSNGRVTIKDGDISLLGRVRIDGLHAETEDASTIIDADQLFADVRIAYFGGLPHVRMIRATKLRVVTTAVDSTRAEPEPDAGPLPVGTPPPTPVPFQRETRIPSIPVRIDELRVEDSSVTINDAVGTRAAFEKVNFTLTGVQPGKEAKAVLGAGFVLNPEDKELRRSGEVGFEISLTQKTGLQGIDWKGAAELLLNEAPELAEARPGEKIVLTLSTNGSLPRTDAVKLDLTATANIGPKSGGNLQASLDWDQKKDHLESKIDLKEINTLIPNLAMAASGDARMESGLINASFVIHSDATGYQFDSSLTGADLSVKQGKNDPTPPIQIKSAQKGVYSSKASFLQLDSLDFGITKQDKSVAKTSLDKPVKLNLDRDQHASGSGAAPDRTNLTIDLDDIDLVDLRAWMKSVGNTSLDQIEKGGITGKLALEIEGPGEKLTLNGKLTAANIIMKAEGETERRGPFTFENEIHGSLDKMDSLTLAEGTGVRLTLEGRELAKARIAGTQIITAGAMDLAGEVHITDMGRTVDAFSPRTPDQKVRVDGGKLDAIVGIKREGTDKDLAFTLSSAAQDLQIKGAGGKVLKRSISADADVTIENSPSQADIRKFKIEVTDAGKSSGIIEGKGKVGLKPAEDPAPGGNDAQAEITISALEAAPWINVMGWFTDREFKSVPVEGRIKLGSVNGGEKLTIDGEEKIGPIRMASGETAAENVTLTIRNNIERLAQDVMNFTVNLAAADTAELLNADMKGSVTGKDSTPQLKASVRMNDFGRTASLMGLNTTASEVRVSGGKFSTEIETTGAGAGEFHVTGTSTLSGATLNAKSGRTLKPEFGTAFDVILNQESGAATVNKIEAGIETPGTSKGMVTASGSWPIKQSEHDGTSPRDGNMKIGIRTLDMKPWAELFGWTEGMDADQLPLDANLIASTQSNGDTLVFEGDQKIGPSKVTLQGGSTETITATLKNRLEKTGDTLKSFTLDLASSRSSGSPDKLTMKASGRLGDKPKLNADLDIASLGADFYLAPFMGETAAAASTPAPATTPDRKSKGNEKGSGADKTSDKAREAFNEQPRDVPQSDSGPVKDFPLELEANIKMGRVLWKEIIVSDSTFGIDMKPTRLDTKIDRLGLNGGTITGLVKLANQDGEQRINYQVQGSGVDLGPVLNSLNPSLKGKVAGKASLTGDGEGVLSGGCLKDTLNGRLLFDLVEGQLNDVPVLEYIAEVTKVDAFRQAVFKDLHGETVINSGVIDLKDVWLRGVIVQVTAGGTLGMGGDYDLKVKPGVGVSYLDKITSSPYLGVMRTLLGKGGSYVDFPLWVTVKGHGEGRKYGVQPDSPEALKAIGDIGKNLGKDLMKGGDIRETGKNLLNDLTGKRGTEMPAAPTDGTANPSGAQSTPKPNLEETVKDLGGSLKELGGGLLGGSKKDSKKDKKKKKD